MDKQGKGRYILYIDFPRWNWRWGWT